VRLVNPCRRPKPDADARLFALLVGAC